MKQYCCILFSSIAANTWPDHHVTCAAATSIVRHCYPCHQNIKRIPLSPNHSLVFSWDLVQLTESYFRRFPTKNLIFSFLFLMLFSCLFYLLKRRNTLNLTLFIFLFFTIFLKKIRKIRKLIYLKNYQTERNAFRLILKILKRRISGMLNIIFFLSSNYTNLKEKIIYLKI